MITAEICVPAHVCSKRRSAWHFAIVAICVRSQMLYPVELRALYLAKSTVVAMKQCKTVQKVRSPAIEAQTIPQGADSFNQTSGTHLQGAESFSRPEVWTSTGKDNLVRHKSGRYYATVFGHQRFLHAYRARRFVIESLPHCRAASCSRPQSRCCCAFARSAAICFW